MNNVRVTPDQKARTIALFLYLAVLLFVSQLILGQLIPPATGGKAVWFYTGVASLLLGNHLVTPYFSKPVDAISYCVAAAAALYGAENLADWNTVETAVFYTLLIYFVITTLLGFIAILSKDSTNTVINNLSKSCFILTSAFGNHRSVFGITVIAALYLFHRDSWQETFFISLACLIAVLVRPDEIIFGILQQLKKIWRGVLTVKVMGEVVANQTPNIFLIRQVGNESIDFGKGLVLKTPNRKPFPVIALDTIGKDDGYLIRAIEPTEFPDKVINQIEKKFSSLSNESATHLTFDAEEKDLYLPTLRIYKDELVGLVTTETSNEKLFFEIATTRSLQQGLLLQANIQETPVIYQLTDGLTKEEIVHQKNTFGFIRAEAKRIGSWNPEKKKFEPKNWIPNLNTPVFIAANSTSEDDESVVGHFPGGDFPVRIKSVDDLVTHNTAILGILGVGKTMLAIELVERLLSKKIKVICLDLTDQYADELADYYSKDTEQKKIAPLNQIGKKGKTAYKQNVEEGGSVIEFREALKADLKTFLDSDTEFLKIYNPSAFEVWKQDSKLFSGVGSMAMLTPCQITHIISELCLELMQERGMSKEAKLCLVYEEAHSLVPEWNSVVAEGDKLATSGTARAILQGRKFGMGCMLITQRTANVTKTILNQCNTIFAMRTFDDTGKEFLANYIGNDYAKTLSSLPERHAIFFGKASSCENPVMIRLNDQSQFRKIHRNVFPLPKKIISVPASTEKNPQTAQFDSAPTNFDDDIPF